MKSHINDILSVNLLSRTFFGFSSQLLLIPFSFFIFMADQAELAVFFIMRSLIMIFMNAVGKLIIGQNTYRFITKSKEQEGFYQTTANLFFTSFFFVAFLSVLYLFFINLYIEIASLTINFFEKILIFGILLFQTFNTTFNHYFQIRDNDFLSGISSAFFSRLITLLFLTFFYFYFEIKLSTLLISIFAGHFISTILFGFLSGLNKFVKDIRFLKFVIKNQRNLLESISTFLSTYPQIYFAILGIFIDDSATVIIGFVLYILPAINIARQSLALSSRTQILKIKSRDKLIMFMKSYQKVMFLYLFGFAIAMVLTTLVLSNLDHFSNFQNYNELIIAINVMAVISIFLSLISLIFGNFYIHANLMSGQRYLLIRMPFILIFGALSLFIFFPVFGYFCYFLAFIINQLLVSYVSKSYLLRKFV